MKTKTTKRFDPWSTPENEWQLVEWVSRLTTLLENSRPLIGRILHEGLKNPTFRNLLIELGNIDYEIQRHHLPRYDDGEIVSPEDWGGHGGAEC